MCREHTGSMWFESQKEVRIYFYFYLISYFFIRLNNLHVCGLDSKKTVCFQHREMKEREQASAGHYTIFHQ